MIVVVDNNVIIDALKPNHEFEVNAQKILQLASNKTIKGFISANSITDVFYVLRKEHGEHKTKIMLKNLVRILNIIGIEPVDCITAFDKPMSDLEDALIDECAHRINADYIVSRDEKFVKAQTEVELKKR
ncbi:MAG: PIN domain-containing protein [Oscillospiraceae bacterium]|nr:PIN domain-containing protein [Oscillospiraceae bacterium]